MNLKRVLLFLIVPTFLFITSCKKAPGDLQYQDLSGMSWVTGKVVKGDKKVMWFQLFDNIDKQEKAKKQYASKTKKVNGKYPATISDSMVWVLINDRIEIRLMADSTNKEYQTKEKLLEFINSFDIDGLASISGDKKDVAELKKFCPKLEIQKK